MKTPAVINAEEAALHIKDGAVIVNTGMLMAANAEEVLKGIETVFLKTGHPKGLTLLHSSSQSDGVGGIEHLAHEGLVDRIIGGHWGLAPRWMDLIRRNKVCAYNIPQGQMTHLYRAMSCGEPGCFTKVGLGTFIDPRIDGGKMNERARASEDIYEVIRINGEEFLHYKPVLPDVILIRGTYADEDGNMSISEEGVKLEAFSAVLAAKRNEGIVIAQVKQQVKNGIIPPQDVSVPGAFIDFLVVAQDPENNHRQCSSVYYSPDICGKGSSKGENIVAVSLPEFDVRQLIGRRAVSESRPNEIINMGIGIPNDTIGSILENEQAAEFIIPTVESGIYGGVALGGPDFGVGRNCTAIIPHEQQFDFYDGCGVDTCFMGVGEIDQFGNINSTQIGSRIPGAGGFIDITQNAKKVVFCTTFSTKGFKCRISPEGISIIQEGSINKFVNKVQQISFNGKQGIESGQKIVIVTERCVFHLIREGFLLTEIAPGIDLERDIILRMPFRPILADRIRVTDRRYYRPSPFGLKDIMREGE